MIARHHQMRTAESHAHVDSKTHQRRVCPVGPALVDRTVELFGLVRDRSLMFRLVRFAALKLAIRRCKCQDGRQADTCAGRYDTHASAPTTANLPRSAVLKAPANSHSDLLILLASHGPNRMDMRTPLEGFLLLTMSFAHAFVRSASILP